MGMKDLAIDITCDRCYFSLDSTFYASAHGLFCLLALINLIAEKPVT
jgi:hypothetical protein